MTGVAPGWYPDPAAPETQRYWDGEQWVGAAIPADAPAPATPPAPVEPAPAPPQPEGPPATLPQYPRVPTSFPPRQPEAGDQSQRAPGPPGPAAFPPRTDARPALPASIKLAPLGSRLGARVVDIVAVFGLNVVVNGYFFYQYYREVEPVVSAYTRAVLNGGGRPELVIPDEAARLNLIMSIIAIALWFAYEVPATANTGQTLGKRLLGIKVARLDGKPFTFGQSIRRWFVIGFPTLLGACGWPLWLLDCLWCTWDRPARQCLHDKVAQTVVVIAPRKPLDPSAPTNAERRDDTNARLD